MKRERKWLPKQVGSRLKERGWTLAVAESCTGGLLGSMITDVAGSSKYFLGGVVAYSDRVKIGVLKVKSRLLAGGEAVSPRVALDLARGVRRTISSDVGVGVTGIAGPGGGDKRKPLGLVYCAVVTPEGEGVRSFRFQGTRREIKRKAAISALKIILTALSLPESDVLRRKLK